MYRNYLGSEQNMFVATPHTSDVLVLLWCRSDWLDRSWIVHKGVHICEKRLVLYTM